MGWMRTTWHVAVAALLLALAGCGGREVTEDVTRTATGVTGTGTGVTGTATGEATGTATGVTATGEAAACKPVGRPATADATITVALDEWSVSPERPQVGAGTVTFLARNTGEEPHELVVIRAASAAELPTGPDGSVDESQLDQGQLIGEIEAFPAGQDCPGAFDLKPGNYVLICNIVERQEGATEAHFREGMHTEFQVTA